MKNFTVGFDQVKPGKTFNKWKEDKYIVEQKRKQKLTKKVFVIIIMIFDSFSLLPFLACVLIIIYLLIEMKKEFIFVIFIKM